MAIHRLAEEAAFGEADIARLAKAYECALELLQLKDRYDPATEVVAAKIIEVYRAGEHDPPRLCVRAIQELGIELPPQPRNHQPSLRPGGPRQQQDGA